MSLISRFSSMVTGLVNQISNQQQVQQTNNLQTNNLQTNNSQTSNRFEQSLFEQPPPPKLDLMGGLRNLAFQVAAATGHYQPGHFVRVKPEVGGLNLRGDDSLNGAIIRELAPGTPLQVATPPEGGSSVSADGKWVYVQASETEAGWVSTDYVQPMSPAEANTLRHNQEAVERFRGEYIDQLAVEEQVGGDRRNANCGPSSTVVAFRLQGLEIPDIPGIEHNDTVGADVQAMRYLMYNGVDDSRDGVHEGRYSLNGKNNENRTFTGFVGIANAVEKAGGTYYEPGTDADSIRQALDSGSTVIVSGTFVTEQRVLAGPDTPEHMKDAEGYAYRDYDYDGQPDTDDLGNKQYLYEEKDGVWPRGHNAMEHLIAVVGTTPEGNFVIIDPIDPGGEPRVVTPAELEGFMEGNAGAMAIDGPANTRSSGHVQD